MGRTSADLEKDQAKAKMACTKLLAEIADWGPGVSSWSVEQYDKAYKIMTFAENTHLADDDKVGGHAALLRIQALVAEFEKAEGARRAQARFGAERDAARARAERVRVLRGATESARGNLATLKHEVWRGAVVLAAELNGPVLTPAVKNKCSKALWQFPDALHLAERDAAKLPAEDSAVPGGLLLQLEESVGSLIGVLEEVRAVCAAEKERRARAEAAAVEAAVAAMDKQRSKNAVNRIRRKRLASKLTELTASGLKEREEERVRRHAQYDEAVKTAQARQAEAKVARERMRRELEQFSSSSVLDATDATALASGAKAADMQRDVASAAAQEAAAWSTVALGMREEHELLAEESEEEEEAAAEAEAAAEVAAAAAAAAADEEGQSGEVATAGPEVTAAEDDDEDGDDDEEESAEQQAAALLLRKQQAEKTRAEEIARERALLDEAADDGEDERARRVEARRAIRRYRARDAPNDPHDVWRAARSGDLELVRCFVMVQGTRLLSRHNTADATQGGRTLLHTAALWGHERLVSWLLLLGCAADEIDSAHSRTTPLIEAARANRGGACRALLRHGADIGARDNGGSTALHWAARRGHGALLRSLCECAEKYSPGSTAHAFDDALWLEKNGNVAKSTLRQGSTSGSGGGGGGGGGAKAPQQRRRQRRRQGKKRLADLAPNGAVRATLDEYVAAAEHDGVGSRAKMGRAFRMAKVMGVANGAASSNTRAARHASAQERRYGRTRLVVEERAVDVAVDTNGDGQLDTIVQDKRMHQFVTRKAERDHVKLTGVDNLLQEIGLGDDQEAFFRR